MTQEHTGDPQAYPKAYLERIFQMYLPGDHLIWKKSRKVGRSGATVVCLNSLEISFPLEYHNRIMIIALKTMPKLVLT